MDEGTAKGLLLYHLQEFARLSVGPGTYERMVGKLGPADQHVLNGIILAGGTVPVGTWNRALDTFLRSSFTEPERGMADFAAFLADRELRGVVKFVLKLGSPEFMLNRADFLWKRYFSSGTFKVDEIGPRNFRLLLDAPTDENVAPSRWSCAYGPGPWLSRGLALAGCPEGTVEHVKCRFDGGHRCEFRASW